jgi:hypothetical protein
MSSDKGPTKRPWGAGENRWREARGIESFAGEMRVNLIRLVAILLFYGHHLANVVVLSPDDAALHGAYHTLVMALVLAWTTEVVAVYVCLVRGWSGWWLKFAATAADILLVTAVLVLTADQRSMLSVLYFLVIAAAGLRLSLPLVYASTAGTILAHALFIGYSTYWLDLPDAARLSRANQVILLLSMLTAGLLAGQLVRQARRLAVGYPMTALGPTEDESCRDN